MKKLIIILLLMSLCGCERKVENLKEVSDIVVSLFNSSSYDKDGLTNFQVKLIDNYIGDLTNPEINVTKYMIKDDFYKTTKKNTTGIYKKKNECYIRYNDIEFLEPFDHNTEKMSVVVCNGYNVELLYDSVKPIIIDYDNPVYNYRFLGYFNDNGYHFAYRSYYDGSGLVVSISDKVSIEFTSVDSLKLKTITKNSYNKYIFSIVAITILIVVLILLKKKNDI